MSDQHSEGGVDTITKDSIKVRRPKQYRVILLNDDYTSMDFVVMVLERIFKKSPSEAVQIMMQVHNKGSGMCGVYTKEVAETKINQVHVMARERGFPLKCRMEEA